MRTSLIAVFVVALLSMAGAAQAGHYPYPWCAVDAQDGTYTCIFPTIAQCQAYAIGMGYCVPNPTAR